MASIVCSTQAVLGFRLFNKPATPQTPLTPAFGARAPQRLQQAGAFSLSAGDLQPNNSIFTQFTHPDVPAERKPAQARQAPVVVVKPADDEDNFQSKVGKPRFRSALEQVSYLTNESAMRRQ